MKKLLFSLSLLASLATFAGESTVETTAQVFGVLPITSSANDVIVSVPWVAASNTDTNLIAVTDIFKKASLTDGDWIRVWGGGDTNGTFKVWTLTGGEWVAGKTVSAEGVKTTTDSADTYLERGDAIVLHRDNPIGDKETFVVYGQYKSTGAESVSCVLGTSKLPAYTLIAPPAATNVAVNSITWENVNASDYIVIGNSSGVSQTFGYAQDPTDSQYKWGSVKTVSKKNKTTGKFEKTTTWVNPPDITAGTGLWYVSCGGTTAPKATW